MKSSSNVWVVLTSVAVLAVLSVALMGCPPQEPTDEDTPPPPPPPEAADMDDTGEPADTGDTGEMDGADRAEAVDVTLTEFEIDMPTTLPAGMTTFNIENAGDAVHNLEIEGQGIERELDEDLQPGESGSMEVDLQAGEYEVYCPVGDHADQGMRMTLTVEE